MQIMQTDFNGSNWPNNQFNWICVEFAILRGGIFGLTLVEFLKHLP